LTTDQNRSGASPSIGPRVRALEGNPVLLTLGLLALFIGAHSVVLWALDEVTDWVPLSTWGEAAESLGVALLCTPLVLVMLRRFERRTSMALQALDVASDGFWIADEQGHLLEVNQGYVQMTGYTSDQLRRMSFTGLQAPQLQADLTAQLAAARVKGHLRFDSLHRHQDGHLFEVEVSAVWLPEQDCVAAFVRERAASDADGVTQARALRRLVDSTAAGLCEVDEQGCCTSINPAALKMLDREGDAEELIGAPVHELLHAQPPLQPRTGPVACPLCEAHRAGKPLHLHGRLLRRFDGRTIDVAYWSQPVFEGDQRRGSIDTFVETDAAAS
jgi:PAS domain S-box-containing protein